MGQNTTPDLCFPLLLDRPDRVRSRITTESGLLSSEVGRTGTGPSTPSDPVGRLPCSEPEEEQSDRPTPCLGVGGPSGGVFPPTT